MARRQNDHQLMDFAVDQRVKMLRDQPNVCRRLIFWVDEGRKIKKAAATGELAANSRSQIVASFGRLMAASLPVL